MIGINMQDVTTRPGAGGYVIRITKVENNAKAERLEFEFDIAEGAYKNYYMEGYQRWGFWGGRFIKSYKAKARSFFKDFIISVLESNSEDDTRGLVIGDYEDIDETKLLGLCVGMVVGEKEYTGNDGKVKKKLDTYNAEFKPVRDIMNGNYTVPQFKPLEAGSVPSAGVVDTTVTFTEIEPGADDDIPF